VKRLSETTIEQIRNGKRDGSSLNDLAQEFGCSKSTVSYYCRDIFSHPSRQYQTLDDVRYSYNERKKARWKSGKRCPSDFKSYPSTHRQRTLYPCRICGNLIRRRDSLCIACYHIELAKLCEITARERELRQKRKLNFELKRLQRLDSKVKHDICPINGTHHWILDSTNIGECKYCGKERVFALVR